jgi:hypothetical protein
MTRFRFNHHTKSIVAAIVAGALALAAPAGASVLDPVNAGWNPGGGDSSTSVTAISHEDASPSSPSAVQTVNATYHPPADTVPASGFVLSSDSFRALPTVSQVGSQTGDTGDGLDVGTGAIGVGAALLIVSLGMLGSSAISGRRKSTSEPGMRVSRTA